MEIFISAVVHMHAKGVVHGDIHPGNALVMEDGTIAILDFGMTFLFREKKNPSVTSLFRKKGSFLKDPFTEDTEMDPADIYVARAYDLIMQALMPFYLEYRGTSFQKSFYSEESIIGFEKELKKHYSDICRWHVFFHRQRRISYDICGQRRLVHYEKRTHLCVPRLIAQCAQ